MIDSKSIEALGKIGTTSLAIAVIGFILWEQTKALKMLATALVKLVEVYSGGSLDLGS